MEKIESVGERERKAIEKITRSLTLNSIIDILLFSTSTISINRGSQYFENGHIFWNGETSHVYLNGNINLGTILTPQSLPTFEFALHTASVGDFTGKVMHTGVNIRSGLGVHNVKQGRFAPNTSVTFNAWAYGTTHWDPIAQQNDNRFPYQIWSICRKMGC